jgi:hypothetical protein
MVAVACMPVVVSVTMLVVMGTVVVPVMIVRIVMMCVTGRIMRIPAQRMRVGVLVSMIFRSRRTHVASLRRS